MKTYISPPSRPLPPLPPTLRGRRRRSYPEWNLRRWGQLPSWEESPAGYQLRQARERTGLTQQELARKLGTSQQAVAQAERFESNPTVAYMRQWAAACGCRLVVKLTKP